MTLRIHNLDGHHFDFQQGTINSLLGGNAEYKTFLLRLIAGIEKHPEMEIFLEGNSIGHLPPQKRGISFVFQNFINYPTLTVFENLASPLKLQKGLSKNEIYDQVKEMAKKLKIDHYLHRAPIELSGGQQQRLAIGRALLKNYQILLLDSPLVNLDYKLRESLIDILHELISKKDKIVIYSTNSSSEVSQLGGNVYLFHKNEPIQFGPFPAVYSRPKNIKAIDSLIDLGINYLPLQKKEGKFFIEEVPFNLVNNDLLKKTDCIGILPQNIRTLRESDQDFSLSLPIKYFENNGQETHCYLGSKGSGEILVNLNSSAQIENDSRLEVYFGPNDLYFFDQTGECIEWPS